MTTNNVTITVGVNSKQLEKLDDDLQKTEDRVVGLGKKLVDAATSGVGTAAAISAVFPPAVEIAIPIAFAAGSMKLVADSYIEQYETEKKLSQTLKDNIKLRRELGDTNPLEDYNQISNEIGNIVKKRNKLMMQKEVMRFFDLQHIGGEQRQKRYDAEIAELDKQINLKRKELHEIVDRIKIEPQTTVQFDKPSRSQQSTLPPAASKPVDSRTLSTVEVNPLAVKKAGDVVGLISTQMKDAKLATVELGKSFQQTGQQASKALGEMSQDAKKTGMSLSTISNTGAIIGKTIAQSIESGTGALKAVLKKILTMLLDFLEKELLAAQAAATLRTLFGDFSAIAQIAAGIAAIELAKVAVNSFAQGGWINEPVVGRGLRSGQMYTLGERGPEYVMPNSQLQNARFANSLDASRIEKAFSNLRLRTEIRGTDLAVIVERGNRINRGRRL